MPGLYSSIFGDQGGLTCGTAPNAFPVNAFGGCTIGGSSAINAGLFFEPPSSDWDQYMPDGWKAANMSAGIKRLYAMQPSTNETSMDGIRPLQSGYDAARKWLVDGLGYEEVDINADKDDKTKVFGHPIYDYQNGQRGGPVTTYLQEALKLPNFMLHSGVRVTRVNRVHGCATGVVALLNGTEFPIWLSSKGRVILSAGALASPALLMRSAIGPPDVLTELSTAGLLDAYPPSIWLNNSAVGAGLFDNPNTFIELSSPLVQSYSYSYSNPPPPDAAAYLQNRSGPYTFAGQTSVFWDSVFHEDDNSTVGFQGTIGTAGFAEFTNASTITLNVYGTSGLLSRGRVVLSGPNFAPGPSADVYYSNPRDAADIAGFIFGIFQGLLSAAGALSGLLPLNMAVNWSVDQIAAYITTGSAYARGEVNHWSSSCRIGACVDVNTTVIGMRNLHVVDAAIVEPLTVNPQFGVMAVAERGSEVVLGLMG